MTKRCVGIGLLQYNLKKEDSKVSIYNKRIKLKGKERREEILDSSRD